MQFLASNRFAISKEVFFSKSNIGKFIETLKCSNSGMNVSLIHLSEICKFVSLNLDDNLFSTAQSKENFTLKNYHIFNQFLVPKTKQNTARKVPVFDNFYVKNFILQHWADHVNNACMNSNTCRINFMLLTGLRYQSTLNLSSNSNFISKKCPHCKNLPSCKNVTVNCFNRLVILETKTFQHDLPLVDYAQKCYWTLLYDDNNVDRNYASNLKETNDLCLAKFSCTSHGLRKFLPNFMNSSAFLNNTGNWTNGKTMQSHYLHEEVKYSMIVSFIRENG